MILPDFPELGSSAGAEIVVKNVVQVNGMFWTLRVKGALGKPDTILDSGDYKDLVRTIAMEAETVASFWLRISKVYELTGFAEIVSHGGDVTDNITFKQVFTGSMLDDAGADGILSNAEQVAITFDVLQEEVGV